MGAEALLARAGLEARRLVPLSGGDIASVWRAGDVVLKVRAGAPEDFFAAEARGLRALAAAGVRVPAVRYVDAGGIVLEYLPPGPADPVGLAEQLAILHGASADTCGWPHRLYLGSVPLPAGTGSWPTVWRTLRIAPLLAATGTLLGGRARRIERLLQGFDLPCEGPVLVHGDLWSGNLHMAATGAALIDPAARWAERGVDLAMMRLFGGFPPAFWDAYQALRPVPREIEEAVPLYQLLYLLVHVRIFGAAYLSGVDRVLRTYGA